MRELQPGGVTAPPLLSVQGVVKDFRIRGQGMDRRLRAVDGVSFSCEKGETVGIVGESGCGKTTLGRLVAGLVRPTAGAVAVGGLAQDGPLPTAGGARRCPDGVPEPGGVIGPEDADRGERR